MLVRLERANAAGQLVARLGRLRIQVIEEMRGLARDLDPQPLSMVLFGSLARGDAGAASDIDILAVRPAGGGERWAAGLTGFSSKTQVLTGNRVQILDYDLPDLQQRYAAQGDAAGARCWQSVAGDALTLAGADLQELMEAGRAAR